MSCLHPRPTHPVSHTCSCTPTNERSQALRNLAASITVKRDNNELQDKFSKHSNSSRGRPGTLDRNLRQQPTTTRSLHPWREVVLSARRRDGDADVCTRGRVQTQCQKPNEEYWKWCRAFGSWLCGQRISFWFTEYKQIATKTLNLSSIRRSCWTRSSRVRQQAITTATTVMKTR